MEIFTIFLQKQGLQQEPLDQYCICLYSTEFIFAESKYGNKMFNILEFVQQENLICFMCSMTKQNKASAHTLILKYCQKNIALLI